MHILGECEVGSEVGSCSHPGSGEVASAGWSGLLKQRDPRPVGMGRTMQTQGGQQGSWAEVAVIGDCRQQRQG